MLTKFVKTGLPALSMSMNNNVRAQFSENLFQHQSLPYANNKSSTKRKMVKVTVWVKPIVKEELERVAKREELSMSAASAAFLEKALQNHVDLQYGALLQPIIEHAIQKQMRTISTRLAWLLVRVAFDAGQTRSITTNILSRQAGVTEDVLKTILTSSGKSAKGNITRRTPQISELIETVEQWMVEDDKKKEAAV